MSFPRDYAPTGLRVLHPERERIKELTKALAEARRERDELRKLLSPEVQAACQLLQRNADMHPDACCSKCALAFVERDQARQERDAARADATHWRESRRVMLDVIAAADALRVAEPVCDDDEPRLIAARRAFDAARARLAALLTE